VRALLSFESCLHHRGELILDLIYSCLSCRLSGSLLNLLPHCSKRRRSDAGSLVKAPPGDDKVGSSYRQGVRFQGTPQVSFKHRRKEQDKFLGKGRDDEQTKDG